MVDNGSSVDDVLHFWFGRVEQTIIPTENRARIWFGDDPAVDEEIKSSYGSLLHGAINGALDTWVGKARGELALIIMLDQFSRHAFRDTEQAYASDAKALSICLQGLEQGHDHQLSLIERVFYYFPLLHSELLEHQEMSVEKYQMLPQMAFTETRVVFDSFVKFANHHYSLVQRFGRFPQRNIALARSSTPDELQYLQEMGQG